MIFIFDYSDIRELTNPLKLVTNSNAFRKKGSTYLYSSKAKKSKNFTDFLILFQKPCAISCENYSRWHISCKTSLNFETKTKSLKQVQIFHLYNKLFADIEILSVNAPSPTRHHIARFLKEPKFSERVELLRVQHRLDKLDV